MSDRTEVNRSSDDHGYVNHLTYTGPGCAVCGNQINMHKFLGDRRVPNPVHDSEINKSQ